MVGSPHRTCDGCVIHVFPGADDSGFSTDDELSALPSGPQKCCGVENLAFYARRHAARRQHSMSTARFDELIHAPTRLEIVSLLAAVQWADFKYIRDELGLSDSALSNSYPPPSRPATSRSARDLWASARAPQPASAQSAAGHSTSTWRHSSKSLPGHSTMATPGRPLRPTPGSQGAEQHQPGPEGTPISTQLGYVSVRRSSRRQGLGPVMLTFRRCRIQRYARPYPGQCRRL